MQNDHAEHLAKAGKEALELIKEFNETDRLMREQRWDELIAHVQQIVLKYPLDTAAYNFVHPYPPYTPEQAGENCKAFLRWKLVCTVGEEAFRMISS